MPLRPLLLRAVRRADLLRRAGVVGGARVAVVLRNRPWVAVAVDFLACAWIGAVAVLIGDSHLLAMVDGPVDLLDELIERGSTGRALSGRTRPGPDDPLDIVFSSGTTGTPHPAVFRHRDWAHHPWGAASRARHGVVHCGIPFGTSTGVHGILLRHLAAGVLSVAARSAPDVPQAVERFDCRELVVTPYSLRQLLSCGATADGLARIRTVKVVAGPLSGHLASATIDAFPQARVFSIYGATELGPAIFTRLVKPGASDALGVPSNGARARIADERGAALPHGAVGEIQVSRTASAGVWTGTGDLGYLDERGGVHLVGRAKEIMFLPTGRTAPEEIEDRLLADPLIEDCGVAAIDSAGGWDRIGVCVVPKEDTRAVAAMLAGFEPALSRVRFVPSIPRTGLGKPVRAQLWRLLTAPEAEDLPIDRAKRF